jgi:hypothetical protein
LEIIDTPWKISGLEKPNRPAPLLGEHHNDYVRRTLLGLNKEIKTPQDNEIIMSDDAEEKGFYLD